MIIKRHIPNFVDHEPSDLVEASFETLNQLLEIPFVKNFGPSLAIRNDRDPALLMHVTEDGYEWWVIGRIYGSKDSTDSLGLPIFAPKYYAEGKKPTPKSNFIDELLSK